MDRMRVKKFAVIMGADLIKIPYIHHKKIPVLSVAIHISEMSLVSFVFHNLINCGTRARVVNAPAENPIISM